MRLLALLALPFLSHPKSLSYSHVIIFLFVPVPLPQGAPRVTPSFLSVGSHFPGVTPRDGQVLRWVGSQQTLSTWDQFGLWPSLISPLQSLGIVQLAAKGHSSALQAGRL